MKIWVESHFRTGKIVNALKKAGIVVSSSNPDFVITYGGDGTILDATRKFTAPIVPIRKSFICSRCMHYSHDTIQYIIKKLLYGKYKLRYFEKIEAVCRNRKLIGLNEVQVHNTDPRIAIRFSVKCGSVHYKEIIGDGIAASTAYGSTAYYNALGYKPFLHGCRLGFNNTKPRHAPLALKTKCIVKLLRGPAALFADNNPFSIKVKAGDSVVIRKSREQGRFVEF